MPKNSARILRRQHVFPCGLTRATVQGKVYKSQALLQMESTATPLVEALSAVVEALWSMAEPARFKFWAAFGHAVGVPCAR